MDKSTYYLDKYLKLTENDRLDLLNGLADKYNMVIKEIKSFGEEPNLIHTAVYEKEGKEFVFVPGVKNVELGFKLYDYNFSPMTKAFIAMDLVKIIKGDFSINNGFLFSEIRELQAQYDKISNNQQEIVRFSSGLVDDFLLRKTSQSVLTDISPMIVEVHSEEIQWILHKEILLDDLVDQMKYFTIYKEMVQNKKNVKYDESVIGTKDGFKNSKKYVLEDDRLVEYHYRSFNHEKYIYDTIIEGYSIPTDVEWQYLAGGLGSPIIAFEDIDVKNLNKPNHFGLVIANDVHKPEIIADKNNIVKGGDNGFYLNNYPDIAYLPLSPAVNSKPEILRDIYARKIIRVDINEKYRPKIRKNGINKYIATHDPEKFADEIIYVFHKNSSENIDIQNVVKVLEIYHSKGMYNKIIETVKDKVNFEYSDAKFLYIVGNAYFKTYNYELALEFLNKAISVKRNYPNCYQVLAHIYRQKNMMPEMRKALHYVKLIKPKIARDIIISLIPERITIHDRDLTDDWEDFTKDYMVDLNESSNSKETSSLVLINVVIRKLIEDGAEDYLKKMDKDGFKLVISAIEEIENSKYVKETSYLSPEDLEDALNYTYICKDTLNTIHSLADKPVDSKVLQDLTNIFFDYADGLISLAYIHFLNSQIFEADTIFNEDYIFLQALYKDGRIDPDILDQVTLIFVDLVNELNTKLIPYGDLLNLLHSTMDKIVHVKKTYGRIMSKNNVYHLFIESLLKDIKAVLKHYNLKIDYHDIVNRIK